MHQRENLAKDAIDRRIKARELAFQAVFQYDMQATPDKMLLEFFFRENADDQLVRQLAREWTFGTIENTEEIDLLLASVIKRWKTKALMPIERAILRLSTYQLLYCKQIPGKVVVNEAIELSKKFSTENSPSFVNGILDAILKKQNSPELSEQTTTTD